MLKTKKLFVCICIGTIFFVSGCASKQSVRLPESYKELKSQSFLIDGQRYVSLDNFCQAYSFTRQWNSISRHVFLNNPRLSVALQSGSSIALVNGCVEYMSIPVMIKGSNFVIPLELAGKIDGIFTTPVKAGKLKLKTVVIDPGHGGQDPGAIGRSGLREKDVVLDVALNLKKMLEAEGIKVIMTRQDDIFISLWKRAYIANNNRADFFISIHANASTSRRPNGFEVYCLSNTVDDDTRSIEAVENTALQFEESSIDKHNTNLDAMLWDLCFAENRTQSLQLAGILCSRAEKELVVNNRGVKFARFYVLKGVRIPSILVEIGFVSNTNEEKNLKNPAYRKEVAGVLAGSIRQYRKEFETTNGFTD
ncbi:MAG: N-acetylmuramoyl-L-alanine amidase [Candidatus Omnitrophota bacterium]